MKTSTLTLALLIAAFTFGTVSMQAQRNDNKSRGNSSVNNNRGGTVKSNQGGGVYNNNRNNSGPDNNRVIKSNQGGGNAYGQDKNRNQGQGNAYGHDKGQGKGKGNAYGHDKQVNVNKHVDNSRTVNVNHTRVVNDNRTVVRDRGMARRNVVVTRPHRVHTVNRIDNTYTRYRHGGYDYSYRDGHYYRHGGGVYTRCAAPYGLRIRIIPAHYNRIVIGAIPYFYFGGIYYRQYDREYEVVQPPVGAIVPELPEYGVAEVTINGEIYYEFDNVLYKPVVTRDGVQYRVVGNMDVNN